MVRIVITGVCGKVGNAILNLAIDDPELSLAGFTETMGHPLVGKKPEVKGNAAVPVISGDLSSVIDECDVIIDFTAPDSSLEHFKLAATRGKAIVVGTTGFSDAHLVEIGRTPGGKAVISPNMSVGMNLMFDVVEKLSAKMKDDYDIEIVEMHHRLKKDAPSGTALKIKEIVEMSEPNRRWVEVFGREGILGP
jgi:4-hydroxy-tetrahydrodipicolinate reductase